MAIQAEESQASIALLSGINFTNVLCTSSFYVRRSQKRLKTLMTLLLLYALLGSTHVTALLKHVGEINPWSNFRLILTRLALLHT